MTAAEAITIIQAKGQVSGTCRCKRSNKSMLPSRSCPACAGTGVMHLCSTCKGYGINPMTSNVCASCSGNGYDSLRATNGKRVQGQQAKATSTAKAGAA